MTTKDCFIQVNLHLEKSEVATAIIRSNCWESENPHIEVLLESSTNIFAGKVDRELWKSFADCFEQDPVEFFEQNRKALSCAAETVKYKYSIRNKSEEQFLIWSKELDDGAVAKCGEIALYVSSSSSIFEFVRHCVGIVVDLTQEVAVQSERATEAKTESAHLVKEYEKIIEGRVSAEEELFSKYHALLNAKKRKIRDLQVEQY